MLSEPILLAMGNFLVVDDELQSTDLIHIPGGGYPNRLDYTHYYGSFVKLAG